MSEVKVNKITPTTNCGTVTLGDSGDTISIPAGASLSIGGTVSGIEGIVNWDTTAKTANFTAVSPNGYFVNTTSGAITVTLPATPTAGDLVAVKDYAFTADTNNITLARNGSNIQGTANDFTINTQGRSVTLIYVDGTQGWLITGASQKSDISNAQFVTATGGCITTCGDYKIHTFTSPGTFCVSCGGNACGSNTVDYLVVAGGAGGGGAPSGGAAGGGGAGGFRLSATTFCNAGPSSPRSACVSALPVSATAYPITVGAGGAGGPQGSNGCAGSNSVFSTITSAGGGYGSYAAAGGSGGSGGGSGNDNPGGSGNTPPVSPPQGMPSAQSAPGSGSGGGGALVAASASSACCGSPGGAGGGVPTAFGCNGVANPTPDAYRYYAGGGGGGIALGAAYSRGLGGLGGGGGGKEYTCSPACSGTANTGGGGGGGHGGGAGGSGIVIIRYKYQ